MPPVLSTCFGRYFRARYTIGRGRFLGDFGNGRAAGGLFIKRFGGNIEVVAPAKDAEVGVDVKFLKHLYVKEALKKWTAAEMFFQVDNAGFSIRKGDRDPVAIEILGRFEAPIYAFVFPFSNGAILRIGRPGAWRRCSIVATSSKSSRNSRSCSKCPIIASRSVGLSRRKVAYRESAVSLTMFAMWPKYSPQKGFSTPTFPTTGFTSGKSPVELTVKNLLPA